MLKFRNMLLLVATLALSGSAWAQTKIRLAHELPVTHYGHVYIDRWAKLVKERSNGSIEVQVFPSGQLYKDADAIQALNNGSLDMQLAVASYLSVVIPAMRIVDRSRDVVVRVMRGCVSVGRWLSVGCLVMMGAQFAGLPYSDYLASVVPRTLLVQGYVITYPLSYTSPIYRANAWIGLEPSIVSLQLGVCFLLAVLLRMRIRTLLLLGAGIAATLSGSGVFVIVIGIVVLLISRYRRHLRGYFAASAVGVALVLLTPFGQQMASRITELSKSGSSASLRSIDPYAYLWARWTSDTLTAVLGHGAGSSQKIITDSGIPGLLVPSPIKVFFDYGLIAGVALALYLLFCYVGGPSRAVAVALLASSWVLQPGTTTFVLVLPTLLFVTWWAPRASPMLELDPLRTREGLE